MSKTPKIPFNTHAQISTSSELRPAVNDNWQARRELAAAMRRLNDSMLSSDASTDQLRTAAALVNAEAEKIEANERVYGYIAQTERIASREGRYPDLSCEYPPGMGQSNAVAPPLQAWQGEDGRTYGKVIAGWGYEGPSKQLHGGIISLLFDQIVGIASVAAGGVARTGTLTIRYHSLTPLNTPLNLVVGVDRVEGRKQIMIAELWVGNVCTASCEAILITAKSLTKADSADNSV